MIDEEHLAASLHNDFYYCSVCHVCKVKSDTVKTCRKCGVYKYCSQQHQLEDWPKHKDLCAALAKYKDAANFPHCFHTPNIVGKEVSRDMWNRTRQNVRVVVQCLLKRELTPSEDQMWMFPRACSVCYKVGNLMDCPSCPGASYCSASHRAIDSEAHKHICKPMQLQYAVYYQQMNGFDDELPKTFESFKEVTESFSHNFNEISKNTLNKVAQGEKLTWAATLFNALSVCAMLENNSCLIKNKKSLIIHVVGTLNEWVFFEADVLELYYHWINDLQSLEFIFVGPELTYFGSSDFGSKRTKKLNYDFQKKCEDLKNRNATASVQMEACLYDEYLISERYQKPDIVVVFNCGFHELEDKIGDKSWLNSLPLLLIPNIPLIFTSYTEKEAIDDLRVLIESSPNSNSAVIYKKCEKNPYHGPLPLRDWMEPNSIYFSNYYYSILIEKELVSDL